MACWSDRLLPSDRGGSDLFLIVGVPPAIRVSGNIVRLEEDSLEASDIENVVLSALSPAAAQNCRDLGYSDSSLRREGLGRFRINFHRERGRPAACSAAASDIILCPDPRRTPR